MTPAQRTTRTRARVSRCQKAIPSNKSAAARLLYDHRPPGLVRRPVGGARCKKGGGLKDPPPSGAWQPTRFVHGWQQQKAAPRATSLPGWWEANAAQSGCEKLSSHLGPRRRCQRRTRARSQDKGSTALLGADTACCSAAHPPAWCPFLGLGAHLWRLKNLKKLERLRAAATLAGRTS